MQILNRNEGNEVSPFGNPDGARSEVDISSEFVNIYGSERDFFTRIRVVFGREGSGKTLFLRRMHVKLDEQSNFVGIIPPEGPSTTAVLRFWRYIPKGNIEREWWMRLWRAAIYLSVLSHLIYEKTLKDKLHSDFLDELKKFSDILPKEMKQSSDISAYFDSITSRFSSRKKFEKYLFSQSWSEFETFLAKNIDSLPPMYFFLDGFDENFSAAPYPWLSCCKGLFYEIFRLLRNKKLGGRIHIIASFRNYVLSSIRSDDNAAKILSEPHIKILEWDKHSISFLFDEKINKLSKDFLMSNDYTSPMLNWIGMDFLYNEVRKTQENCLSYFLRHTRMLPRDVINLGNLICEDIYLYKNDRKRIFNAEKIRKTVSLVAASIGKDMLKNVARHIISYLFSKKPEKNSFDDFLLEDSGFEAHVISEVVDIIKIKDKDILIPDELEELRILGKSVFNEEIDVVNIFWLNGLLGFKSETEEFIFFTEKDSPDLFINRFSSFYAFHPCLIDAIQIKPVSEKPVIPL